MPPAGQSVRMSSIATQATASQNGAAAEASQRHRAAASTPYQSAWTTERPSQGTVPTACIHHSRVKLEGGRRTPAPAPRRGAPAARR